MVSEKITTLAERIEMVKYHFKLNNGQLGDIAGVTASAIFDILHGKTENPKISLLKNISQNLSVNLVWLVTGEGEMLSGNITTQHSTNVSDPSMVGFLMRELELKNTQILEKDKMITWLRDRLGKRKGVSNQAVLLAEA